MNALSTTDLVTDGARLSPARRFASLAVLSLSLLAVVMDLTVLNVALPKVAADLRPSATQQLWIVDSYSLVLAGLIVSASALADRWGRKRLLMAGFAVFGVASLLVLVADSAGLVIAVRALLGLGGAMIMPTTLSMIRVVFTNARERAIALGVWSAVSALGAAVGPIIGGLLLEHMSWHAAFLVNVPLMAIGLAFGAWLLPESREPSAGRWDVVSTALSITGMALLVWAIKDLARHYPDDRFSDPLAWAALAAAAGALIWFTLRCLRRPDPILDFRLFTRRSFSAGTLTALTVMFAMGAMLLLAAQWLQLVEGHSPLRAGVYLLPLAAGAVITSPAAPLLTERIGARSVLAGGLAVAGIGFLLLDIAPRPLSYFPWVVAALVLQGAGAGALAIASALIMSGSPPRRAGSAAVIEETAYDLGNVLGIAILGSVASVIYRDNLHLANITDSGALTRQDASAVDGAKESLGGALEIARQVGLPDLAIRAQNAFAVSFADIGLIGGVSLFIMAAAVFAVTPRGVDITEQHQ